ncbi:MAG: acpS [Rickettsiaceae bacterium]|jgi:holo-[acyl-carrier protein] synthase|nr:acpS [Rickettsiaceae bacterium]
MIEGIGVDSVQIPRIEQKLSKWGLSFAERILGPQELDLFLKLSSKRATNFLAKRFAAKEAITKALGCGIGRPYRFTDIQILNSPSGQPYVVINEQYDTALKKIHVSLTDDPPNAIAFAIVCA